MMKISKSQVYPLLNPSLYVRENPRKIYNKLTPCEKRFYESGLWAQRNMPIVAPSLSWFMRKGEFSRRTANNNLARLRQLGLVVTKRRFNKTSIYKFYSLFVQASLLLRPVLIPTEMCTLSSQQYINKQQTTINYVSKNLLGEYSYLKEEVPKENLVPPPKILSKEEQERKSLALRLAVKASLGMNILPLPANITQEDVDRWVLVGSKWVERV